LHETILEPLILWSESPCIELDPEAAICLWYHGDGCGRRIVPALDKAARAIGRGDRNPDILSGTERGVP